MKQPIKLGRLFSKRTLKVILSWLVLAALIAGGVFAVVKIAEYVESNEKTLHPGWARGDLDSSGDFVDTKNSIYTKKAFECAGLNVKVDFDANIEYDIIFYDEDGEVLMLSNEGENGETVTESAGVFEQTGNFDADETMPEGAVYCRIVIRPLDDSNISLFEIAKYAKKLTIKVAK